MSLRAENVIKKYGYQKALNNVSFEINTGEIVGFLGPNGAGKSTMMKIITGYISQTSGKVFVNEIDTADDIIEIRKQIGYLPEHNPLYLNMYVREYLNFVGGIYELGNNIKHRVNEIIELTGLGIEKKKKVAALSKGYRQRLGLAAALIHDPKVLILDEPTTGLDPNQIIEIRNLISKIGEKKTIMLSTHIMQEVEAICDRVIILDRGKVVADKAVKNISALSGESFQNVFVEFDNNIKYEMITSIENIIEARSLNNNSWIIKSTSGSDIRSELFDFAVKRKCRIITMYMEEKSMEDVFRELTK